MERNNPVLIGALGIAATVATSAIAYRYVSGWLQASAQTTAAQTEQASAEQNAASIRGQMLTETWQPWLLLSIPVSILLGAVWLAKRQSKQEEEYDAAEEYDDGDSGAGYDGEYEEESY
jgi:hypothetical protein